MKVIMMTKMISGNAIKYPDELEFKFGKYKCSCLDSAYERKAIDERLNFNPVFDENK